MLTWARWLVVVATVACMACEKGPSVADAIPTPAEFVRSKGGSKSSPWDFSR